MNKARLRGARARIEFFHQTRFSPRRIVLVQNAFCRGFVEFTHCRADIRLRVRLARLDGADRALGEGTRLAAGQPIARPTVRALANFFQGRLSISQVISSR